MAVRVSPLSLQCLCPFANVNDTAATRPGFSSAALTDSLNLSPQPGPK